MARGIEAALVSSFLGAFLFLEKVMKEVIAQEIVRRIASEVFAPKGVEKSSGLDFQLYPPRTDEEIVECAERVRRLAAKALQEF